MHFNPHSHAGSDYVQAAATAEYINFNPHSHAGSDTVHDIFPGPLEISIHTPTQGVTVPPPLSCFFYLISIHTPTQGVTAHWAFAVSSITHFNPHSHAGSDYKPSSFSPLSCYFNPHSHAGSDIGCGFLCPAPNNFNPHSHAGSDIGALPLSGGCYLFQSTLPRRE